MLTAQAFLVHTHWEIINANNLSESCSARCNDPTELGLRYSQREEIKEEIKEEKVDDAILMAEVMDAEDACISIVKFLFLYLHLCLHLYVMA